MQKSLPEGVQVSFRGVNYIDFFAFQRFSRGVNNTNIPKSRGSRQPTGRVWFPNVIALPRLQALIKNFMRVTI
jgi:hypothetical protein